MATPIAALKSSRAPLAEQYRLALLDLDGVVYRGADPVPAAADSIAAAKRNGMVVSYTTNNPSRHRSVVVDQLRGFGIDAHEDEVITSAVVGARMLAAHVARGAKVLVVGADHLREQVRAAGFEIVDQAAERPAAVIEGWYPQVGWQQLAQAAYAIEAGAEYYVTNRDLTIPREQGIAPGNGAMVNAVVTATGVEPCTSAGKPEAAMYDEERAIYADCGNALVPVNQSLPVGDRLDTDIEAANRGGYDSLCVLTGVATPKMLMTARSMQRPTYISVDLRGLLQTHQAPRVEFSAMGMPIAATLNGARASVDVDAGVVRGIAVSAQSGDVAAYSQIDALRCACQLAWALADGVNATGDYIPQNAIDISMLELPEFRIA